MTSGNDTDVMGARCRRLTVMVVEDHADTLEVWRRVLAARGYRVLAAPDRCTAIELGVYDVPDVLIADARLPDGDGWDLLPLLRERHPGLTGVAVTAHGFPEHQQRSRAAGFCRHLTKPVSVGELMDAVTECVARRAA